MMGRGSDAAKLHLNAILGCAAGIPGNSIAGMKAAGRY